MQKSLHTLFSDVKYSLSSSKFAFTMLEMVFVIVVAGILATTIVPRFTRDNLQEAADQTISYLRYTKHLALIDDKFDTTDLKWFKTRWQMVFAKNSGSGNEWSCTIFSDWKGTHSGNPDKDEIAKNPLDPKRYLTGGTSGNALIHYDSSRATKELNIGDKYGIKEVKFIGGCSSAKRIAFDYIGRPIVGNQASMTSRFSSSSGSRLLEKQCKIVLCQNSPCNDKNSTIAIEPITGYIHFL